MKKFRKHFALMLALSMLLGLITVGTAVSVSADTTALLELDFSNFQAVTFVPSSPTESAVINKTSGIAKSGSWANSTVLGFAARADGETALTKKSFSNAGGGATYYIDYYDSKVYPNVATGNSYSKHLTDVQFFNSNLESADNTVSFWVDVTESAWFKEILCYRVDYTQSGTAASKSFDLGINPDGTWNALCSSLASADHAGAKTDGAFSVPAGWKHVVITNPKRSGNSKTMSVYVNGEFKKNVTLDIPDNATINHATVSFFSKSAGENPGSEYWRSNWWPAPAGQLAEVKVYDGVLTGGEIQEKYNSEIPLFTVFEPIEFLNADGEEALKLDGLSSLTLKYNPVSDEPVIAFAACCNGEGKLLEIKCLMGNKEDTVSFDVPVGTSVVKGYAWYASNLNPIIKPLEISYSDGFDPGSVSVTGDFYDGSGNAITYMAGKSGINGKVSLTSANPPAGVKAELYLDRNGSKVFTDVRDVAFTGQTAEVTIPFSGVAAAEGDKLVLTVYTSAITLFEKKIDYIDGSKIVDVLLVMGQSNAEGQGGNSEQSEIPEDGTVYRKNMNEKAKGNNGWDNSLGKKWHEETGHTVLIVKATWGATGFPPKPNFYTGEVSTTGSAEWGYWNPDNTADPDGKPRNCYAKAKQRYAEAIASIDTTKYTIGDCIMFWNQGENENLSYTAADYEAAFMEMYNSVKAEFGSADSKITACGILPIRSNQTKSKSGENLLLTGPRIAQYNMAKKYDDIALVMDCTEYWYKDEGVKNWFEAKYAGITYPLNGGIKPSKWRDIIQSDDVHYLQPALNEMGQEAAKYMLAYIKGTNVPTGIDLITPTGIQHYENGASITLGTDGAIPVIPAPVGTKAAFSINGRAAIIDENGVLRPCGAPSDSYSTLTVTPAAGSVMTFKIYSPTVDNSIAIAEVKDNKDAIYTITTDDGFHDTNFFIDEKLQQYNMRATLGVVTSTVGGSGKVSWNDLQTLVNSGRWDLANHTKNHKQSTFSSLTEAELQEEINGARQIILEHFPSQKVLSVYTPGGISSSMIKSVAAEEHLVFRLAGGGNNSWPLSMDNIMEVSVNGPMAGANNTGVSTMNGWIDSGISGKKWIVEMWHGIGNDASSWSGNVSEQNAAEHFAYAAQKRDEGKLWVATLDEVAVYNAERLAANIRKVSESSSQMVLSLTDGLDNSVYDQPITLNITIPSGKSGASVTCGGNNLAVTASNGKISFSAVPDTGNITINWQ
ncbi:MAG: polysaccharide deacetylase family protein [Clostridia bacterium]|nr:polysaccharide deacetylase family protein [Clostridia bacterium]